MELMTQSITLSSDNHYGSRLPAKALGTALHYLPRVIKDSVAMAIRGRSRLAGRPPAWLDRASTLNFLGHTGVDDSVLIFDSPTLGAAVPEIYAQQEFWSSRPDPNWTGLDILGRIIRDLSEEDGESSAFDKPLLERLTGFENVLNGSFHRIAFTPSDPITIPSAVVTPEVVDTARRFSANIPASRPVQVAGRLDMVRASTGAFAIHLDDGQEIRGTLLTGSVVDLRLTQRVLVRGKAIFKPSGRLLRIDADRIVPGDGASAFWSRVPTPLLDDMDLESIVRERRHLKKPAATVDRGSGGVIPSAGPRPIFGRGRANLIIKAEDDEHLKDFEEYLV